MTLPHILLANLIVLSAGLFVCQTGFSQCPQTAPQESPIAVVEPSHASLLLELDRAILVLKRGQKEHWSTRDQYLTAFEKIPGTDPTGRIVTDAKNYVECIIAEHLRTHQAWDEGLPIEIEVQRTIDELIERKEGQAIGMQPSSCSVSATKKVAISAGIAANLLKTKIDPVYPAEALKNRVSGTVVLEARISNKGSVKTLRVLCGPALLQQAALDAVRQWTYRPYQLNSMPIEVETTINVVFAPNR
jgi:protein TonB